MSGEFGLSYLAWVLLASCGWRPEVLHNTLQSLGFPTKNDLAYVSREALDKGGLWRQEGLFLYWFLHTYTVSLGKLLFCFLNEKA